MTWADGTGVDLTYFDPGTSNAGKLHELKTLSGQVLTTYGYEPTSGRIAQIGSVTATSLNSVSQALTHDSTYGQLQSVATKFNGVDNLHAMTLPTYDDLGRIQTKKERVLTGAETTTSYEYDDANGNRTTINGVTVASCDAQDRLLSYNGTAYTNNDNGHRTGRGSVGYEYNNLGNLTTVTRRVDEGSPVRARRGQPRGCVGTSPDNPWREDPSAPGWLGIVGGLGKSPLPASAAECTRPSTFRLTHGSNPS